MIVTTDEEAVADQAIIALSARSDVFQRGGILAHVVRDQAPPRGIIRPKGTPKITALPRATLRERSRLVRFGTPRQRRRARAVPRAGVGGQGRGFPRHVVSHTAARGGHRNARFSRRRQHTSIARLRPGERHLVRAGRSFRRCESAAMPRAARATAAVRGGRRLPFCGGHGPCRHNRLDVDAACPSFLPGAYTWCRGANTRGAGKTLSVDASGIIATGRQLARASAPTDNNEARKLITSVVMAGERTILLDNIGEMFGWPALDAALTGSTWSDRILGANRMLINAPSLRFGWSPATT